MDNLKMNKSLKIFICVIVVAIMSLFVILADDMQQRRYRYLNLGYIAKEMGHYKEAEQMFDYYLEPKSNVYWWLVEQINDEKYSKKAATKT